MKKLSFGMIGGGKGSFIANLHFRGARFDGLAELTAGCFSRSREKSLDFGRSVGIDDDRIYETYQEMAEREAQRPDKIDFVIIAAPNNVHYEAAKIFLEHGINVACDKPVTHTSAQAEELRRIADEKGLLFAVTYVYTAYPGTMFMRSMIEKGLIGKVRLMDCQFLIGNLAADNIQANTLSWRLDPKVAGPSTCTGDIGIHAQNLMSTITGLKMTEIFADMNVIGTGRELDTNADILVRYEGGAKGHIWCSNMVVGHNNFFTIKICGEKGTLYWNQEDPNNVIFHEEGKPEVCFRMGTGFDDVGLSDVFRLPMGFHEGYYLGFANIYKRFETAIINKMEGKPYELNYPTIDDGIVSQKFVETCLESNEKGTWVKMHD